MKQKLLHVMVAVLVCASTHAQVNSGSTGADGAFNPTTNAVINMADHPTGIYHYTSVNIPAGVTVTFTPNANNSPVVWLVQGNVAINGTVDVSGNDPQGIAGGAGGPGGYRGGNGELGLNAPPGEGIGPGGGLVSAGQALFGGNASYGTTGTQRTNNWPQHPSGLQYGNPVLFPLLGGSGGAGSNKGPLGSPIGYDPSGPPSGSGGGGGGGGGAILIASSSTIELNGSLMAPGGGSNGTDQGGGGGGGGGVRLVAVRLLGTGSINCIGGNCYRHKFIGSPIFSDIVIRDQAGDGRVRLDAFDNVFSGQISGQVSRGFQPAILPVPGQGIQLSIATVAGAAVSASPSGALVTPDTIIAGQQSNPVAIVVRCTNLPLNTPVTVIVKPANGAAISAVGYNTSGTLASSTATVSLNMPRGGGLIYATAATAP